MEVRKDPFRTSPDPELVVQQRVTSTCALCGESIEAPVPDAVAWFARHRKAMHPNAPAPTPARQRQRR